MAREVLARVRFSRLEDGVVAHGQAVLYDDRTVVVEMQSPAGSPDHGLPLGIPIPVADFDALYAYGNFLLVIPFVRGTYSLHCRPSEYDPEEADLFIALLNR